MGVWNWTTKAHKKNRKRAGLELNEEGDKWPPKKEKDFGVEWQIWLTKRKCLK